MSNFINAIVKKLGQPIHIADDEHRFICPFCDDNSGHFYVNEEKGFFCQRCMERGRPARLLELLGITKAEVEGGPPETAELWRRLTVTPEGEVEKTEAREVELPQQVWNSWAVPVVREYALRRNVSEWRQYQLGLKAWNDRNHEYRLLFPDYTNATLVYWTARAIRDGVKPKYQSATGSDKAMCVWNLENVNPEWPIYVCEGNFSALSCGPNGVAIYGKYVSRAQVEMLSKAAGPQGVRLVLDSDAIDMTFDAIARFQGLGVPVGAVLLPSGQDPDSLDKAILADMLLSSQPLSLTDVDRLRLGIV
ncbi:hypothetical protein LCGC14_0332040 [marine sediment metagenome]|uniref:Bacteriophage T7 Gp4 DNA primase/helicase N-terminal domain-containing protein n=1 Tax=marine sediment metagenome TaxID=412755 RepID=A0A0F9TG35_9ZZZZ